MRVIKWDHGINNYLYLYPTTALLPLISCFPGSCSGVVVDGNKVTTELLPPPLYPGPGSSFTKLVEGRDSFAPLSCQSHRVSPGPGKG